MLRKLFEICTKATAKKKGNSKSDLTLQHLFLPPSKKRSSKYVSKKINLLIYILKSIIYFGVYRARHQISNKNKGERTKLQTGMTFLHERMIAENAPKITKTDQCKIFTCASFEVFVRVAVTERGKTRFSGGWGNESTRWSWLKTNQLQKKASSWLTASPNRSEIKKVNMHN